MGLRSGILSHYTAGMTSPIPPIAEFDAHLAAADDVAARLREAIRAYVRYRRWAIYTVAKKAGIGDTTLRDIWKPEWNPTPETLRVLTALIPPDFDPATAPATYDPLYTGRGRPRNH